MDEKVQADHPDWAKGLYDHPPLPEEDALLPSLSQVMNTSVYQHLKPMVKSAREAGIARTLGTEEVNEILSRPMAPRTLASGMLDDPESPDDNGNLESDFMSRSLESFVALASQPGNASTIKNPYINPLAGLSSMDHSALNSTAGTGVGAGVGMGPSPGSSIRARKQSKRLASELPGGAATPVPKRRRGRGEDGEMEGVEVEGDLKGDGDFLDSL